MSVYYEVVIYTASSSIYADPLIDKLDPHGYTSYRLFREHCTFLSNSYVKDLSKLGRKLKDIIIVDNSPIRYGLQPDNGIPILTWINDKEDDKLKQLMPLLKFLARVPDVRKYLPRLVKHPRIDYEETLHNFINEMEVQDIIDFSNEVPEDLQVSSALSNGHNKSENITKTNSRGFHCRSGSQDVTSQKLEVGKPRPFQICKFNLHNPKEYIPISPILNYESLNKQQRIESTVVMPFKYGDKKLNKKLLHEDDTESCNESTQSKKEDVAKVPKQTLKKPISINMTKVIPNKFHKHSNSIGYRESLHNRGMPIKKLSLKEKIIRLNPKDTNFIKSSTRKQTMPPLSQIKAARCLTALTSEAGIRRVPSTDYHPGKLIKPKAKDNSHVNQVLMKIKNPIITSTLSKDKKKVNVYKFG